jgi:transglutaminase-like putative cysteine protease
MGITTIISSLIIVSSLVWAAYNFGIIQFGAVREYPPHYEYDEVEYWPYTNNFTGGTTNWNNPVNYSDIILDQGLPNDTLDHMNDTVFAVAPADPGQLWRTGSYDYYDGTTNQWSKSNLVPYDLFPWQEIDPTAAVNQIYTVFFSATAGATVGTTELPALFPDIRIIRNSFITWDTTSGLPDSPSRLQSYTLETDDYGSLLFTPFILGTTGEEVLVSYDITYDVQDIDNVITNARDGASAPSYLNNYKVITFTPTARVDNNVSQFSGVGNNAYEKAMAVKVYFQSTFNLMISQADLTDRPPPGQETTDWFIERGGGLPMDFATAYCVYMRMLDIPARIVKGYAMGTPDYVNDIREIKVRHMQFWAEVFIPMAGGDGEWIQVIPTPLPPQFGGGDPENTPIPDINLQIWPTSGQPWEQIGDLFFLSTSLTVEGIPVTQPEMFSIYDELDNVIIGQFALGDPIDYTFPSDATVDYHIISVTWATASFVVQNFTSVFAVGTPSPQSGPEFSSEFVLSETHELNVSQGIDTHVAYWEDTLHVYGTMTVGGVPVNSSNYDNRNIGIYWDNTFYGNASINEYGYYELNVNVDPFDLALMKVGQHEVWSWYLGDWDGPIPRLNEARSADNSTVAVWGRVGFDLTVFPTDISAGQTIDYDGVAYLLNGTILPVGQQVGVFFHSQANVTRGLNSTGGFQWSYVVPVTQPDGTYFAYANWSSPWPYIAGNWSQYIPINVGSSGTHLTINPPWDPLYVAETITFWGHLTHVSNGSGIAGRSVDIYWNNGSTFLIGSNITESDGYFEFTYTILLSDEGPVEFWSSFTSLEPTLASSESVHIFSNVKKWDTSLDPIFVTPDPVVILQRVDIQGNLTMPEIPWFLANEWVDFWYQNVTGTYYIGTVLTNSTGGYFFQYTIPIGQTPDETVFIWANFTSPYINIYDSESFHEPLWVEATGTLITIQEDFTNYFVNETIFLYGNLQFSNGTPIQGQTVYIHWVNATATYVYQKTTDAFGNYFMFYNCTPTKDDIGFIDVYVNWTSWTPIYDDAFSFVAPQIQLQRYTLEITLTGPSQLYADQLDFDLQGVLSYLGGFPPLVNEWIDIYYWNGTSWLLIDNQLTNSTGGYLSPLTFGASGSGLFTFGAYFPAPDLLHTDAFASFDINRVEYQVNLEVTLDSNPVMQNETLTIHAFLYFPHNGTAFSNADVDIYWDNGTLHYLGTITTDGTGQGDLLYSGMDWDTVRTGIHVYGDYAGTILYGANESIHNILTLQQWSTAIFGVNVPLTIYRLTETVVVSGTLEYDIAVVPYPGATVELTLFGLTQSVDITDGNGDFAISWVIPGSTTPGFYDMVVEFNSPYPWIASSSANVPQIEIIAPGYLWPSFVVSPIVVYLDYTLNISGTVTWDNATPYANSPVDFFWGDPFGVWDTIQLDVLTDGSGNFYYEFTVPASTPIGDRQVWAYIDPAGFATAGMSPTPTITVAIIGVDITTGVDTTMLYLNEDITFSGTLTFTNNMSGMIGYEIQIWWAGEFLTSITISDPAGAFSYVYTIPWDTDPRVVTPNYALFEPPNVSFGTSDITLNFPDVTVMELVDVFLDPEPVDNTVSRGDTLIVTGYVDNNGGFDADSVEVEALSDGNPTSFTAITRADGTFTISIDVPLSALPGSYNISVWVVSPYHNMRNGPINWWIDVFIASEVGVTINQVSVLPSESFLVTVQLRDDEGTSLAGESISLSLGSTYIRDILIPVSGETTVLVNVPSDWTDDGYFTVTVYYAGRPFIDPDTFETVDTIHVFTEVIFQRITAARIDPGQPVTIQMSLVDGSDNPILNRNVRLRVNSTDTFNLSTGDDGQITQGMGSYPDGTSLTFALTLLSTEVTPIQSGIFTINIETTGGNPLQGTELLVAGILLVGAVIAVLAYLYIVRGMFRSSAGISRGFDIPTKLRNIKKLADAGKYGASITLAYRTFEQMCGSKMSSERSHNETAREYLERVLQAIPLDLATTEQFVQTYEEARFSHHEMTRERYEEAVRIFTDLYPRIDSSAPVE